MYRQGRPHKSFLEGVAKAFRVGQILKLLALGNNDDAENQSILLKVLMF